MTSLESCWLWHCIYNSSHCNTRHFFPYIYYNCALLQYLAGGRKRSPWSAQGQIGVALGQLWGVVLPCWAHTPQSASAKGGRCSWPRHLHCILTGICIYTWIWPWFWIAGQHNARSHDVWSSKGPRHTGGPCKTWMTWLCLSSRSWHHRPLMCSPEQASLAGQDFFYTQPAPAETHHFYGTWL